MSATAPRGIGDGAGEHGGRREVQVGEEQMERTAAPAPSGQASRRWSREGRPDMAVCPVRGGALFSVRQDQ